MTGELAQPSGACLNCGQQLEGEFCHACGQSSKPTTRYFGTIFMELLDNFLSYDSRVYRTVLPLLFRPGYVCRRYLEGRRVSFLPPFRLYLFASVVFFLLGPMINDIGGSSANDAENVPFVIGEELEEALLQAARDVGIRMVLCRGGATTSGSHLGLLQANIVNEDIDTMLQRLDDTRSRHHDAAANAMMKLVVAPTSLIHGSPPEHLLELARFARAHDLKLHSHLLEVPRDNEVALQSYGMSAIDYAESIEWLGEDVWFAHLVHVDDPGLAKLAATGTGIAHCPTSNCRLGSGISRVVEMAGAGVPVSLGVDGSASAESGSMTNEAMLAWLIHRAVHGPAATTLEQVMHWATAGGAALLGLDAGRIEAGACADLVVYDLHSLRYGGVWQPGFAPILCGEPVRVEKVMINGRWVVEDHQVLGLPDNVERLISNAYNKLTAALA